MSAVIREHLEQNFAALECADLSPEDMAKIDALDINRSIFWAPEAFAQTSRHK